MEFGTITEQGTPLIDGMNDAWGNQLRYRLQTSMLCWISSSGPDGHALTADDVNLRVTRLAKSDAEKALAEEEKKVETSKYKQFIKSLHPEKTWVERRIDEVNAEETADGTSNGDFNAEADESEKEAFSTVVTVGGGERLTGAAYYWFFTYLMLGTAVCFVVVAYLYQPQEYLQEEAAVDETG
ncbi:MAG: hypothetical protein O3C57_07785 [Verrucomicrobia bacterium]|nr:hypothetical protein [Verrucomicrobiota bacterium]